MLVLTAGSAFKISFILSESLRKLCPHLASAALTPLHSQDTPALWMGWGALPPARGGWDVP